LAEHEQVPEFFEIDLVLHCVASLQVEFARTLTATDVHTGWVKNFEFRNRAHRRVLEAMLVVDARLPSALTGIGCGCVCELRRVKQFYALVQLRPDRCRATTKATDWRSAHNGKNVRVEDKPCTPLRASPRFRHPHRFEDTQTRHQLEAINPVVLTRRIAAIQARLIQLATAKTTAHIVTVLQAS